MTSRVLICAAGAGKTTRIVEEAFSKAETRAALITYTRNNEKEIERKLYRHAPVIPKRIEVMTWYSLLLRELARPYRSVRHKLRIDGLHWVEGRSVKFVPEASAAHYFADGRFVYSDKLSKFICECERLSGGAVMRRLAQRFDRMFFDEVQDLAGYDLEVLELILKSGIPVSLVGDHRQATYRTNQACKNSGYAGINIIRKFRDWDRRGLAKLSYESHTHRCHQAIADLADRFFPKEPATISLNHTTTCHDGVFTIAPSQVESYVAKYSPQVLRLDKRTSCNDLLSMNFGESKGLTFDRVLIFPHSLAKKWLSSGDISYIEKSLAKMYVGVTRARQSVAFVFDGDSAVPQVVRYR